MSNILGMFLLANVCPQKGLVSDIILCQRGLVSDMLGMLLLADVCLQRGLVSEILGWAPTC